jgi:hypothetical protein
MNDLDRKSIDDILNEMDFNIEEMKYLKTRLGEMIAHREAEEDAATRDQYAQEKTIQ